MTPFMLYCRVQYLLEKKKRERYPRMTDTVRIADKKQAKLVAHRGVSGIATENTCAAFIAAGKRSYFGIETDVHRTKDGKFVVFHDDNLKRMAGLDAVVEETEFDTLREITLFDTRFHKPLGTTNEGSKIPTLTEYIGICKQYGKTAVLELKNHFDKADIDNICKEIEACGWLDRTVFISFDFENLVFVRELYPAQTVQFLTGEIKDFDTLLEKLKAHRFDWDAYHHTVTAARVEQCHKAGILVNAWTADEPTDARRLISIGVDYITSNILE